VIALWGSEAGKAARTHIVSGQKEEGWKEGDHFPVDKRIMLRWDYSSYE